ncbi:hypothetical protein [uncultured Pantoea sp.]|uniref:hypothetical protein n=1 Tax=uncultured Pantoea sp. TaxID=218084 RepID=UPI00204C11DE|nr:hypothetical protein [uncultured Pantoea sp.]DAL09277.1 MAG TPA_asm: hypothetical protein [Caudoviricetes sp.]
MGEVCQSSLGKTTLVYQSSDEQTPITLFLPESDFSTFKLIAPKVSLFIEKEIKKSLSVSQDDPLEFGDEFPIFVSKESENTSRLDDTNASDETERQNAMSHMTREELQAHLDKNKAEMQMLASGVREDMAKWSKSNSEELSKLTILIEGYSSKIDGKVEATNGKLEGIQGQFSGMNTAIAGLSTGISGIQSGLSTKLTVFGIIISVVIALVGFGAAMMGKSGETQPTANPVVIQVPQQPATSQPLETPHPSNQGVAK